MESGFRNPDCGTREIFASGIRNPGLIRNTAQGIRNPPKIGPESKLHCQRLEYSTWNPESAAWNPESKTVLDFLQLCRSCPEGLS